MQGGLPENERQDNSPRAGASLRIMGMGLKTDFISEGLGAAPTHVHRAGEIGPLRRAYETDAWMLKSPLVPSEPFDAHLRWLLDKLSPRYQFLLALKSDFKVDIYCYLTVFKDQSSLSVSADALGLFANLGIPLEVSILSIIE